MLSSHPQRCRPHGLPSGATRMYPPETPHTCTLQEADLSFLFSSDNVGNVRTIGSASYTDNAAMTDESCITYCTNKGYIYAGTEYASECCEPSTPAASRLSLMQPRSANSVACPPDCANAVASGASSAATTDCSMACSGNKTEACGGPNRLNLFKSSKAAPAGPVTNPGPPGWTSLGCYALVFTSLNHG